MQHFIVLLYVIALLSGVAWLLFLEQRFQSVKDQVIKDQRNLFLNFTLLLFCCSIFTYLLVNYHNSQGLLKWLSITVVLCSSPMFYFQSRLFFRMKGWQWTKKKGLAHLVPVFTAPITAIVLYSIENLYIMIGALVLQILPIFLIGPIQSLQGIKNKKNPMDRTTHIWQIIEMSLCILLCLLEFLFRFEAIFERGMILSLPIIYLLLNGINYWKRELLLPYLYHSHPLPSDLTPKEQEVVSLLAQGKSNKEIAYELSISASTVKNHIYNVYRKTGAQSRVELLNIINTEASR